MRAMWTAPIATPAGTAIFIGKHGYPAWYFARQMARTACGIPLAFLMLKPKRVPLYVARLRGRWKGWRAPRPDAVAAQSMLEPDGLSR